MVVIVDDDDAFRNGLAEHLRDDGHRVVEYASPAELPALETLPQPALLVTDFQMPGEDGLRLAKRFHEAHPTVPVVLVTARWTEHLDAPALDLRFVKLLHKPLDYEVFYSLVRELTGTAAG